MAIVEHKPEKSDPTPLIHGPILSTPDSKQKETVRKGAARRTLAQVPGLDSLYADYGEAAPRSGPQFGREGPRQDSITKQGTQYLMRGWPKLDYIKTARVIQQWPTQ